MIVKQWKDVVSIISGKNQKDVVNPNGKYPIYGSGGIIGYADSYLCNAGTTIVGRKGTINNPIFVEEPFWNIDTAFGVVPGDQLIPKYLYYFCLHFNFKPLDKSTGRPSLAKSDLLKIEMPVPDLGRQEQIVSQIEESLFQLDSAVETLKKSKQQLEVYRQAVLKEAFEGRLTHSEIIKDDILLNYIEKPRYGTSKKCTYLNTESTTSVYRIPNIEINQMRINKEDIKFAEFTESELEPIRLYKDDILIIRSNGSASLVGRAAIINHTDTNATFAGYLMRLRIVNKNELLPKYLLWYLQSSRARVYIEGKAKSTSGVHNINSTEISNLVFPICDIDEQNKIVEAIESRISVFDTIEHTVNQSLQQAETLRQSILKQAFERSDICG